MTKITENRTLALIMAGMLATAIVLSGCGNKTESQEAAPAQTQAAQTEETQATDPATEEQATDAAATTTEAAPAQTQESAPTYIGDEAAKQAALAHAGLNAADVVGLECELDLDDVTAHYDVDFKAGNMEYDYDINATTGEVMTFNSEIDD